MPNRLVKVFFSYAREDSELREQLYRHLAVLRRERSIDAWYDGELIPGQPWRPEILAQLEESQVVVMLVSSDFLASDFCTSVEMERALERSRRREGIALPVIARACDWKRTALGGLLALPTDGLAITLWSDRDEAWLDTVGGIRRVVEALNTHQGPEPYGAIVRPAGSVAGPIDLGIEGTVTDARTGLPVDEACVTIGPPIRCWTTTDPAGHYRVDLSELAPEGKQWDFYFLKAGYETSYSGMVTLDGLSRVDVSLKPSGDGVQQPDADAFASAPLLRWQSPRASVSADGRVAINVLCSNEGPHESVARVVDRRAWSDRGEQMDFEEFDIGSSIYSVLGDDRRRFVVRVRSVAGQAREIGRKTIEWSVVYLDNTGRGYITQAGVEADFQDAGPAQILRIWLDETSPAERHRRFRPDVWRST